jgi:predicted ATPase
MQGRTLVEQGFVEEGIARAREGLTAYNAIGTKLSLTHWLALLTEAYQVAGQVTEGLSVLAEAFDFADRTEERYYEAELYRLKGALTLQSRASLGQVEGKSQTSQSPSAVEQEAEACFLKAIAIAQKQQAKSLELCAVMSLARLWQSQGKQYAARNTLSEIYDWFTEGFDTKDLQEAKALLEELA